MSRCPMNNLSSFVRTSCSCSVRGSVPFVFNTLSISRTRERASLILPRNLFGLLLSEFAHFSSLPLLQVLLRAFQPFERVHILHGVIVTGPHTSDKFADIALPRVYGRSSLVRRRLIN